MCVAWPDRPFVPCQFSSSPSPAVRVASSVDWSAYPPRSLVDLSTFLKRSESSVHILPYSVIQFQSPNLDVAFEFKLFCKLVIIASQHLIVSMLCYQRLLTVC